MLNMSSKDIRGLFQPLLVLVIIIGASVMALRYTDASVKKAQQGVSAQERLLSEARNKVQQSDQEKGVIERYVEPYTELERAHRRRRKAHQLDRCAARRKQRGRSLRRRIGA